MCLEIVWNMFEMCLTSLDLFENVLETFWNVVSNLLAICPTFTWNWFETCLKLVFKLVVSRVIAILASIRWQGPHCFLRTKIEPSCFSWWAYPTIYWSDTFTIKSHWVLGIAYIAEGWRPLSNTIRKIIQATLLLLDLERFQMIWGFWKDWKWFERIWENFDRIWEDLIGFEKISNRFKDSEVF